LTAVFVLSSAAHPELKKRDGGKIINIGSMASHLGHGSMAVHGATKAGILGLTKACASCSAAGERYFLTTLFNH
jgi:short-subunit dehydrogenase